MVAAYGKLTCKNTYNSFNKRRKLDVDHSFQSKSRAFSSSSILFREKSRETPLLRNHHHRYSEPYQTSKMEHFANIVNNIHPFTMFTKRSILDVQKSSEYAYWN